MTRHIYVDGSGLGIGLYIEGTCYFFETEGVTTNTNEAVAVIMGLKYAIHHKIHAVIFSDSKTAIAVSLKGFSSVDHLTVKGKIAQKLLKKAEELKLQIEISWISGRKNLADPPSRMKGEYLDGWEQSFAF